MLLVFLLLSGAAQARPGFKIDHFVEEHELVLPKISEQMLVTSRHTMRTDLWTFTYFGGSEKLDMAYHLLHRNGHPIYKLYKTYWYSGDTAFAKLVSISIETGDTSLDETSTITNDGRVVVLNNHKRNFIAYLGYDTCGRRLYEKTKFPGQKVPTGTDYEYIDRGEYIESIPHDGGLVDSNDIRWYYYNDLDSVVATYPMDNKQRPFLLSLNAFDAMGRRTSSYGFSVFDSLHPIIDWCHYTYDKNGRPKRLYYFTAADTRNFSKGYRLVFYTQYEYDSPGRMVRKESRKVPQSQDSGSGPE